VGAPQHRSVELRLADAAADLVPAIEAAQYARLVDHADPVDEREAAAIGALVETFGAAAEAWEALPATARDALLAKLGAQLDELESIGLFVHWGRVTLMLDEPASGRQLPLAILSLGRSGQPTIEATIPGAVAIDTGSRTLH